MTRAKVFLGLALVLILASATMAAIPQLLNYQGLLKTAGGTPVPDGSYSVTFTLYSVPAGGTGVWTETKSITTSGGLFSTLLGSVTPIPDAAFGGDATYLGIKVSTDPEMTPRQQLAAVPYANRVGTVDGANGGVITGDLFIGQPEPGFPFATGGTDRMNSSLTHCPPGGVDLFGAHNATFGASNTNLGNFSYVFGCQNSIPLTGNFSTIAGGSHNTASGSSATIGGGGNNNALADYATTGGGQGNNARGPYSTVGGGLSNWAWNNRSTISGGDTNVVLSDADFGTIGGGYFNTVDDTGGAILGGSQNVASAVYSAIGGGKNNLASGGYSTVPGGSDNEASGYYSFAAGRQAKATHAGSFVWADNTGTNLNSTLTDQFRIRANGGAWITGAPTITSVPHLQVNGSISIFNDPDLNPVTPPNGNTSLFFGQENVSPGVLGEWGIQYWRDLGIPGCDPPEEGLNFWKPFLSTGGGFGNSILFLHDNHNVGIKTHRPQSLLHIGGDNTALGAFPVYQAPTNNNGICPSADPERQGLLFNAYTIGLDRRYADIVSLGYANGSNGGGVIRFLTNNQLTTGPGNINGAAFERMRIERNGNVGIGTTTPLVALSVVGDFCATGTINSTTIGTCSDARFKTNVTPVDNGLGLIMRLRGVRYDWDRTHFPDRNFSDARQLGFIAQEVKEVVPELVMKMSDGYYAVDYGRLAPVLVEAIKTQQQQISTQKETIASLTDRLEKLESIVTKLAKTGSGIKGEQLVTK